MLYCLIQQAHVHGLRAGGKQVLLPGGLLWWALRLLPNSPPLRFSHTGGSALGGPGRQTLPTPGTARLLSTVVGLDDHCLT